METPRSVSVGIYESPVQVGQDKYRLAFIGQFPAEKNRQSRGFRKKHLGAFQTTMRNLSNKEVARAFRQLFKVISLVERVRNPEASPRIKEIKTDNLDCFTCRQFRNVVKELRLAHTIVVTDFDYSEYTFEDV